MPLTNPILLIEDDADDAELFVEVVQQLYPEAEVEVYNDPQKALERLKGNELLFGIIFCEAHMGRGSGIDLKTQLAADEKINSKTIPFVFICTMISAAEVRKAYQLSVQGIFLKEVSYKKYVEQLQTILDYWSMSVTPNNPADA